MNNNYFFNIVKIILIIFLCSLFLLVIYKLINYKINEFEIKKIKKKKNKIKLKKKKSLELYKNDFNKLSVLELKNEIRKEVKEELQKELKKENDFDKTLDNVKKGIPINIETREKAEDLKQIGICTKISNINTSFNSPGNNDDSIILGLWGERIHKRSNNWNYYVISDKNNYKIPLIIGDTNCSEQIGCRELIDNDTINILEYNGIFSIKLYKVDAPKYIPYI